MIYFFATIFASASWTAALVMHVIPIWVSILITVALVLLVALIKLWQWRKARKAAKQLESSLDGQADAFAESARPEQQADIQAMQLEFHRAVNALKGSRLGQGGKSALTALPWFVIIGPPGAGKTTALRNSGLHFPYAASGGPGGLRGVAGTRNCEWWLANEAVILDTAGRYLTEDDDREEWFAFLDATRRSRPRHPINGIIAAVSAGEIIGATPEEITLLGKTMRERIDEVMGRLEMVLPVYFVVTKSDLISGFTEFFGQMRPEERQQVWGFTIPLEKNVSNIVAFAHHFDEFTAALSSRAFAGLSEQRRVEDRTKIFEFPEQLIRLRQQLGDLVGNLFAENVYQETPIMRGTYFTSGTQEGRPIDQITNAISEAFGIQQHMSSAPPVVESKSYFIHDVFTRVIIPDQGISGRSAGLLLRKRFWARAAAGIAFTIGLFILMLPGYSFTENQRLIQSTTMLVDDAIKNRETTNGKGSIVGDLQRMRQTVDKLLLWTTDGPPAAMRFGLYVGDQVYPRLKDLYAFRLRSDLLEPLIEADVEALEKFAKTYSAPDTMPTTEEYTKFTELLRIYLHLTYPKEKSEPVLSESDHKWLFRKLSDRIPVLPTPTTVNPTTHAKAVGSSIETYLDLLAADTEIALPRDKSMVTRARNALNRVPIATSALDDIIARLEGEGYDLGLKRMIGGSAAGISTKRIIRGAFTRRGWVDHIEGLLERPWDASRDWVLGSAAKGQDVSARDIEGRRLRSQYFEAYINEWMLFLQSIRVAKPKNRTASLAALQDLTRGKPPVWGRLMRGLDYNMRLGPKKSKDGVTPLSDKPKTDEFRGERFVGPKDVVDAFKAFVKFGAPPPMPPTPEGEEPLPPPTLDLDVYQEQLIFVRDALQMELENPSDGKALMARIKTARTRIKGLIADQETGWRPRFQSILWPPVEGVSGTSSRAQGGVVNNAWCSNVVVPYSSGLKSKYPFKRGGMDAAIGDVAQFYRPDSGTIAAFFTDTLSSAVTRSGGRFQFSESMGQTSVYKGSLLKFLKRSFQISKALFPSNAAAPLVKFSVRIKPTPKIASVSFSVDGQTYRYTNGPEEWRSFQWPGDGAKIGASLRVKGPGVNEFIPSQGEWGLFRLLEDGVLQGSAAGRTFTVGWQLSSIDEMVKIEIRPARSATPFFGPGGRTKLLSLFRGKSVAPPSVIAQKGGRCSP